MSKLVSKPHTKIIIQRRCAQSRHRAVSKAQGPRPEGQGPNSHSCTRHGGGCTRGRVAHAGFVRLRHASHVDAGYLSVTAVLPTAFPVGAYFRRGVKCKSVICVVHGYPHVTMRRGGWIGPSHHAAPRSGSARRRGGWIGPSHHAAL